jgi:hypothetical protein
LDYYRAQGKLRRLPADVEVEQQYRALLDLLRKERWME